MTIAIGSDHRGYQLKQGLIEKLESLGHSVRDCGCQGTEAADYPVAAFAVGELVAGGQADYGVLICGSGIGVSIAANKVAGVRAALCHDPQSARQTRLHNDSNVLCFSGDATSVDAALAMLEVYLATEFEGGRHARRVDLIRNYESPMKPHEA